MTNDRDAILKSIRKADVPQRLLPEVDFEAIRYPDRTAQFLEAVAGVGGTGRVVASADEIDGVIQSIPTLATAGQVCSLVEGVGQPNVDLHAIDDPHSLESVELAIVPGAVAVAENGAIWVTDTMAVQRAVLFLAQHLVLVIAADDIVNNLHDFYARRQLAADSHFGVLISGPSKTADIEQSLVIGAHGARSMTAFVVSS